LNFYLFLIFSVNQYIGHNISLKSWEDFWFKESLAIYLAYEFNSQISQLPIEDLKIKGEVDDVN